MMSSVESKRPLHLYEESFTKSNYKLVDLPKEIKNI